MIYVTKILALPIAVTLSSGLAGCAGSPERPHEDLARAEAGLNQAEQAGAQQYAPLALDSAREKLGKARAAAEREEMLEAERYAEQAALDADLAAAKSRTGKAQASVEQLENSIAVLREEIERNRMQRDRTQPGDTR